MSEHSHEEIRKHVREYLDETKVWRKDSEDMGGFFRNNVNNFVLSVSIIYAIQQDAYQRTSSADVFNMAIEYLALAVMAIINRTVGVGNKQLGIFRYS